MDWNVNQMAVFRAVAAAGHFTRGARAAGVSQPAASKQIADLERSLGVSLFDRGSRMATLTPAGELLLSYADRMAELTKEADTALADLSALRRGRLRIGATPTLGTYLLPKTLVYFRARYPDIETDVVVQSSATLASRLEHGQLDVALLPSKSDRLPSTHCMTDTMTLVCHAEHALARRRSIPLTALAGHRLILRDGRRRTAGFVERMLRSRRFVPSNVLRLPQTESVKQAVLSGVGVAFLPDFVTRDEVANGRLCRISVNDFQLTRLYFLAERDLRVRPKTVTAYACILKHAVRGSLPPTRTTGLTRM